MSYADSLDSEQISNIHLLNQSMDEYGITNKYAKAAILAIISKESEFKPVRENLYYSAEGIQKTFKSVNAQQAKKLANNPVALGNYVYGGKYGTPTEKGYEYRGGGFNQLTFKANYDKYGKLTNTNLGNNPKLIENPKIAAKVAIKFFVNGIETLRKNSKLLEYNAANINDFKTSKDATLAMYHVNAGTGKSTSYVRSLLISDSLGGMTKAISRVDELLRSFTKKVTKKITKTSAFTIISTAIAITAVYMIITALKPTKR